MSASCGCGFKSSIRKTAKSTFLRTTSAAISASPPNGPEFMQVISALTPWLFSAFSTSPPVVPVQTRWCAERKSELKMAHSIISALRLSWATKAIVSFLFIIFSIVSKHFGTKIRPLLPECAYCGAMSLFCNLLRQLFHQESQLFVVNFQQCSVSQNFGGRLDERRIRQQFVSAVFYQIL